MLDKATLDTCHEIRRSLEKLAATPAAAPQQQLLLQQQQQMQEMIRQQSAGDRSTAQLNTLMGLGGGAYGVSKGHKLPGLIDKGIGFVSPKHTDFLSNRAKSTDFALKDVKERIARSNRFLNLNPSSDVHKELLASALRAKKNINPWWAGKVQRGLGRGVAGLGLAMGVPALVNFLANRGR